MADKIADRCGVCVDVYFGREPNRHHNGALQASLRMQKLDRLGRGLVVVFTDHDGSRQEPLRAAGQ